MSQHSRPVRLVTHLQVRVTREEKRGLKDAADYAGIPLSAWIRERLRRAATRELEDAALPIAFLEKI